MRLIRGDTGFTLRRLMIFSIPLVLAAIVGAILLSYLRIAQRRQQVECMGHLKELWTASMMYAKDHDGWLPPYINARSRPPGATDYVGFASPEKLHSSLSKYVRTPSAWFCPSDRYAGQENGPKYDLGTCHVYSSYVFSFGKPGRIRSSGVVGLRSKNPRMLELGTPAHYPLIRDFRLFKPFSPPLGPHYDGIYNTIYLDGHLYVGRPDY